jgi:hypothetical protein
MLVAMSLVSLATVEALTANHVFCERDRRFMDTHTILTLRLEDEDRAMRLLEAAEYAKLPEMNFPAPLGDRCDVTLTSCPLCLDGFLSMTTSVIVDGPSSQPRSRLVYSAAIDPQTVALLRARSST